MDHTQLSLLEITPVPYQTRFNLHRGYTPKKNWFRKGFHAICQDPLAFARDNVQVMISFGGVTIKQAQAIRYWLLACKLAVAHSDHSLTPTPFGLELLSPKYGIDQYLEDDQSLWMLHWKLLAAPSSAPSWWYAFSEFTQAQFTRDNLLLKLKAWAAKVSPKTSEDALTRDYNCLMRMYLDEGLDRSVEETVDYPFREMGLLHTQNGLFQWNLTTGEEVRGKPGLTPEVIAWAALDWVASQGAIISTPLANLCYLPGSPGMAFKLNKHQVASAIASLKNPDFWIEEGADYQGVFRFGMQPRVLCDSIFT